MFTKRPRKMKSPSWPAYVFVNDGQLDMGTAAKVTINTGDDFYAQGEQGSTFYPVKASVQRHIYEFHKISVGSFIGRDLSGQDPAQLSAHRNIFLLQRELSTRRSTALTRKLSACLMIMGSSSRHLRASAEMRISF